MRRDIGSGAMPDLTVGFVGMTHLAINSLAAMAARGFKVVGFDTDSTRTGPLQRGELPFAEPDLPEYFAANAARITFSSDSSVLGDCDIVYVAPDVPTDDRGLSDLGPVSRMIDTADRAMRDDAILVVLSQVPPGFTRRLKRPKSTVYYQVETLIFGRAVERAMYPERYIIGCDDRSEEHTSELQSLMRSSYAVFCLKKTQTHTDHDQTLTLYH